MIHYQCRAVHQNPDQCAFIKANCPDEEAGLLSYLTLYYCKLPQAQPVAFVIIILWLALLFSTIGIAASDFFCINLSTIASILGMSESMAGVTFLAFGNGSPDVFSTFAAMSTHSGSLAVGELIGAAGFITAVVAGSMALVREFKVGKKTFVRDVGFFIFASSFSMVFLADGALYFWECCAMIGFYLFYVATVVIWHWHLHRRRKRRERSALARGHYVAPGAAEIEVQQEDGDDEDAPAYGQRSFTRDTLADDFSALERGGSPTLGRESYPDDESDGDGELSRLLATEMNNSMRVTRNRGPRRNTMNPIRPSLVGALEFRSVLSTLQKSRNIQSKPIHLRRYSDDPTASSDPFAGPAPETAVTADYEGSVAIAGTETPEQNNQPGSSAQRIRAVSMNDAGGPNRLDPATFSVANIPEIGIVAATPTFPQLQLRPAPTSGSNQGKFQEENPVDHLRAAPSSPTFSLSPPASDRGSWDASHAEDSRPHRYDDRLTAPDDGFPGARHLRNDFFQSRRSRRTDSPIYSPGSKSPGRPQLVIPSSRDSSRRSSPILSHFPKYTDSPVPMSSQSSEAPSLMLPEPDPSPDSSYSTDGLDETPPRRLRWWPYRILPCPQLLFSTLFPTLCTWEEKSILDKILSVVSAPSIFLLTITLPVVEPESKEDDHSEDEMLEEIHQTQIRRSTMSRLTPDSPYLGPQVEPEWLRYRRSTQEHHIPKVSSPALRGLSGHHDVADRAVSAENAHHNPHLSPTASNNINSQSRMENESSRKDWNRWLVAVQIFTAPLFVVLIIWANGTDTQLNLRRLVRLILYSLLGSLVIFSVLLLTTTAERPPKYRFLLCFLGFTVSVSWISTIANEVVGVLKALGVIFGISDAILGLTIFAVGNSLGDLVADITVARLGFPVMALSACFGGPMLNILLGIGIGGLYMTIKDGHHKHAEHPDKPLKYKPYQVEVNGTLIVSGITLLVTLVGLLIAVPLNKWIMSRRIGWGLIILWSISTIINLTLEITGVWGDASTAF
jgi:solute carrier family 24 (sodium/potassium/calcium exchanger), member 6